MNLTQPTEDCDTCLWWCESVNYVPLGATYVQESRLGECELGYQCDCPPGTYQPKPKGRDLRAEHAGWLADLLEELER